MAYAKIIFEKDPKSVTLSDRALYGTRKSYTTKAPVGFSWITLFLNFIVPFCKGDYKWAAIMFLCGLPLSFAGSASDGAIALLMISFSVICHFYFSFNYNKFHIKELIGGGWQAKSLASASYGTDPLGALLDSLRAKWGMEIPRIEAEDVSGGEEK